MELSPSTFWDIDIKTLNQVDHADFIIRRVFDKGNVSDLNEVLNNYETNQLIDSLISAPYLDKKTLSFVSNYFNIPPEQFRCYSKIQSAQNALSF